MSTVAAAAGVSTATVSRVLSGSGSVTPELAERVRRAAEEVGYHPNAAARVLASGRHRNVGVVIPDAANPYFLEVIKAFLREASERDYRTLVADSQGGPAEEFTITRGLVGTVDGIVLLSSRISRQGLRDLSQLSVPVVLVNRMELGVDLPMVAVDNFSAMLRICGHLADLGHRRVVYVAGSHLAWQNRERWRAVTQASAFGIEATSVVADGTIPAGRAAAEQALAADPTAIVCFNDLAAIGVMSRLRELGIRVPEEVSVTGFDGIDLARYNETSITTAISPRAELGRRAWQILEGALAKDPRDPEPLLPAELLVGESTGPARPLTA